MNHSRRPYCRAYSLASPLVIAFSFIAMVSLNGACIWFDEPSPDKPFIFPDQVKIVEESDSGGSSSGGSETSGTSDSGSSSNNGPCTTGVECPSGQFCDSGFCADGCDEGSDCGADEQCNVVSHVCTAVQCPGVTCAENEFLTADCTCQSDASSKGSSCKILFNAGLGPQYLNTGLSIFVNANADNYDLLNACDNFPELAEYECVFNGPGPIPEVRFDNLIECNYLEIPDECLARSNIANYPFGTISGSDNALPFNIYLIPDDPNDPEAGGIVQIKTAENPQYPIFNKSPDLPADSLIDFGRGGAINSLGHQIEPIFEGRYEPDQNGNLAIHFGARLRIINLLKSNISHDTWPVPDDNLMRRVITDYNDPRFIDEPGYSLLITQSKASSEVCPSTGSQGVEVIPALNKPFVELTTDTAIAMPGPAVLASEANAIQQGGIPGGGALTVTGCPIGPASDCICVRGPNDELAEGGVPCGTDNNPNQKWMRLVAGLPLTEDNLGGPTCLLGLFNAAAVLTMQGPVLNADGTDFIDVATACEISEQVSGDDDGEETGGQE